MFGRNGKLISELLSLLLMLTFIVLFSIGTLRDLDGEIKTFLMQAERVLLGCFAAEYAVRCWAAENKPRYMLSFYGLIDGIAPVLLLALLFFPFLSDASGFGALRMLTVLRLITALKVLRHCEQSIRVFYRAFVLVKVDLAVFFTAFLILIYLSSVAVYLIEYAAAGGVCPPQGRFCSVFDGLWWAVVTLTTVGYGDFTPATSAGKVFTFVILVLGMAMIAIPDALLTSAFQEVRKERRDEMNASSSDET